MINFAKWEIKKARGAEKNVKKKESKKIKTEHRGERNRREKRPSFDLPQKKKILRVCSCGRKFFYHVFLPSLFKYISLKTLKSAKKRCPDFKFGTLPDEEKKKREKTTAENLAHPPVCRRVI